MPAIKPPAERVQIITAKAGDTIVVMTDETLSAEKRGLMSSLVSAKLPQGVKVLMLDRGMTVAHIEAIKLGIPHIPMPSPGRRRL